jgi:hypothetical protein
MLSLPWSFLEMTKEPTHITFHMEVFITEIHTFSVPWLIPCHLNARHHCHQTMLPNPLCKCQFVGSQHLTIHLAKTKACTDALFRMANNHEGSHLDVPPDNDKQGGNEPIDTNFKPDHDVDDDATMPWECLQP